ncbi:glutamate synthase subunit beta [Scatolibacter rhodanostii]|uniref:glutamate synthase subunit beta n=1 Tax=Scatolibacter rhodanostii TaxID=2014781 RepID=UPI000C083143|nr:glutamate synthase subunit beta [Scatolibacter rhodanostii]
MGKATGFLDYERIDYKKRAVDERIKDWGEIRIPQTEEEIKIQAARCMSCGIPFCHAGTLLGGATAGCPLHNLIPEWNDLVYKGQWEEAYRRLSRTNPFPEFTGRVCPAPCEGSCTEGYHMEAVTISAIEYEIIEKAFAEGYVKIKKAPATGKKVAIIGSGPAGLSSAHYLNMLGHQVTVYERHDRAGGLLMYGIPNMKLDKSIIERRLSLMQQSGIEFVLNTEVGKDISTAQLLEEYDAVLLCAGATKARGLNVEGKELSGVHFAVDFLSANTKSLLDSQLKDKKFIDVKDKNVIIIGGGDTGTDCAATSLRHGCQSVYQFEIMPEMPQTRQSATNPWPEWPKKLKVDYGQQEAIAVAGSDPRQYLISTKKIVGDAQGNVKEVHTVKIGWVKDEQGRMIPKKIPGSEKVWKADIVLLAMGFLGPEDTVPVELSLERDARSNVKTPLNRFQTSADKVFAAGDMRRGQSLVVWAIQEGKLAAAEVHEFLLGKLCTL